MKIRTITTGFELKHNDYEKQIERIGKFNNYAKGVFERKGITVQTTRISTQPWQDYFKSARQILKLVKNIQHLTYKYGINYFNIGPTNNPKLVPLVENLIKNTSNMFTTVMVSDDKKINYELARRTARLIKKISRIKEGFESLRFTALFNTKPGSPFYPAAYHKGPISFAVGCENSDLVLKAFSRAKNVEKAENFLLKELNYQFGKIENTAKQISNKKGIKYGGIDVSIATSVKANESIATAFEKLGLGKFGEVGTLAIAKIITSALQKIKVKKCGYSGLMLPVLEDYGLAKRNDEGLYNITNLLTYSAVCGTGLDTIPLPGNVSEKKLYALLLDIASLSIKLNKPLSARLMPVPNKKAKEMTKFVFPRPYFINTKTMSI